MQYYGQKELTSVESKDGKTFFKWVDEAGFERAEYLLDDQFERAVTEKAQEDHLALIDAYQPTITAIMEAVRDADVRGVDIGTIFDRCALSLDNNSEKAIVNALNTHFGSDFKMLAQFRYLHLSQIDAESKNPIDSSPEEVQ